MNIRNHFLLLSVILMLTACGSTPPKKTDTTSDGTSKADTAGEYRVALARRITQTNSIKVYVGRPQALLRSIIVVKYAVDANGRLLHSEILRTNHDRITEATALSSLRVASPFPKPAPELLRYGKVKLIETWLFNNDGRFQLRTIAEPQMDR